MKKVSAKTFQPLELCCKQECFKKISTDKQEKFHKKFWELGDYCQQNLLLSTMLKSSNPKVLQAEKQHRLIHWTFFFPTDEENIIVCRKFLSRFLCLGEKRIRTVQNKILNQKPLKKMSGGPRKNQIKLTENIKEMLHQHCESIPHRSSHYKRQSTSLKYFENPSLNLKMLYKLFAQFHLEKTGKELPISETVYSKYFNYHVGFSFKLPRTDVCNTCYESETSGEENAALTEHKEKARNYLKLKNQIISENSSLCCEFDFAQNLPLPKIPVSEQFYKRLLWLFLFNVHVHNTGKSYMFSFLEGISKKGANTVCSFIQHTILAEFDNLKHSSITLFSDGCPGQNKNYTVFNFLILLSEHLKTKVKYVFPIRGHSYCQCDRNFGTYSQKLKRVERIETSADYVDLIRNARSPPFTMVENCENLLQDFEESFKKKFKKPKNLQISKALVIKFFPDGNVNMYDNYEEENPKTFLFKPILKLSNLEKNNPPRNGLTEAKVKDVKSLTGYLSCTGRQFLNNYFSKIIENSLDAEDSEPSDESD